MFYIFFAVLPSRTAEELANFLASPAPAPDFFSKRLQLLVFFSIGSGSKEPKTPGSDRLRLWLPSPDFDIGKVTVTRQSTGPLRPLSCIRVTGTLGKCQWLSKSRATEATDMSQGHWDVGMLEKCPAKSQATDISQGHLVTGTLGKCQWPGKVPGH